VSKNSGIAASPLLNITGHDHVLSLPLLQWMNEHNLRIIQEIRDDGRRIPEDLVHSGSGKSASFKLQKAIDELIITEDGDRLKGKIVNNQLPA